MRHIALHRIIAISTVLIIGIFNVFKNPIYSGADEAAHFDYINYITDHKKLPLISQNIDFSVLSSFSGEFNLKVVGVPAHARHEAVQPPLYYFLGAIVATISGIFSGSYAIRLFAIRLFGLALILATQIISFYIYDYLLRKKIHKGRSYLFSFLTIIFLASPVFTKIMIPLNNEHLNSFLCGCFIFFFLKLLYEKKLFFLNTIITSILVALLFLTKVTSFFFIPILLTYLILVGKIKFFLTSLLAISIIIMPWIWFNLINYGAFTGVEEHLKIVLPIVNPNNIELSYTEILQNVPVFLMNVWYEKNDILMLRFFSRITSLISFISFIFFSAKMQTFHEKKKKIILLSLILIYLNILVLVYITASTSIYSLNSRYMFLNVVSYILLSYFFINKITDKLFQKLRTFFKLVSL